MTISVFDLFSIGVGPSSSHTVGPMRAANLFLENISLLDKINTVEHIKIDLYGSLALTGIGHGTDFAAIMGLEANAPENIDPIAAHKKFENIKSNNILNFSASKNISFNYKKDLVFHTDEFLKYHANGIIFTAYDVNYNKILSKTYYSVGGGFVVPEEHYDGTLLPANTEDSKIDNLKSQPYLFKTATELLEHCNNHSKSIAEIMFNNELAFRSEQDIKSGILNIWQVMKNCIEQGLNNTGVLPGGLNIPRRASVLYKKLSEIEQKQQQNKDIHINNDINWLSLYAIAVNEENAAGMKVVTAPTNGAAGVIPAVLYFYYKNLKNISSEPDYINHKIVEFLLTAAAIGILYKERASISAAEVGCQGEVGVACSMAAAAYTAVLGGNIYQVENAAEIGMEHNLGLTCDPIGGLVQIPCIERNAAGAVQAINAAQLALLGDGEHYVSLDKVINTMRETGRDMMSKYKETSLGGLAVNLPEC